MQPAAAIDLGSNALRIAVATLVGPQGSLKILASDRELLRLGAEVFAHGEITKPSFERAAATLERFLKLAEGLGASRIRAVATSAIREASNKQAFVDYLQARTGIAIDIITGQEEARLVHRAVSSVFDITSENALLFDIGGGSIEISLATSGRIVHSNSFPVGAIRLARSISLESAPALTHSKKMEELTSALSNEITKITTGHHLHRCIGTGGNIDAISEINVSHFGGRSLQEVSLDRLDSMLSATLRMSDAQRCVAYGMSSDRASVLGTAIVLAQIVLRSCHTSVLSVPHVGLKDGVLLDLLKAENP